MTLKIRLAPLRTTIGKPAGYYEEFVQNGLIEGDFLFIEQDVLAPLLKKYAAIPTIKPEWPIWARAMKQFAKPDDKGIGDVVARMIGDENSAAFKAWHIKVTGKTCGCAGRQAKWNRQYPL